MFSVWVMLYVCWHTSILQIGCRNNFVRLKRSCGLSLAPQSLNCDCISPSERGMKRKEWHEKHILILAAESQVTL